MKARSLITANIGQFFITEINFEATDYIELINWEKCKLTEPPITTCISDECLTEMVTNGHVPKVKRFPCHTQGVERCIILFTEASVEVCGYDSRYGYIRARLASRQIMPSFNTISLFQTKKIVFDS